jgi:hypothetical protein
MSERREDRFQRRLRLGILTVRGVGDTVGGGRVCAIPSVSLRDREVYPGFDPGRSPKCLNLLIYYAVHLL